MYKGTTLHKYHVTQVANATSREVDMCNVISLPTLSGSSGFWMMVGRITAQRIED